MDRIVNLDLLRHPYNWIIVALMLAIGVMGLTALRPALANPLGS